MQAQTRENHSLAGLYSQDIMLSTSTPWINQLRYDTWQDMAIGGSKRSSKFTRPWVFACGLALFFSGIWASWRLFSSSQVGANQEWKSGKGLSPASQPRKALVIASYSGQDVSWIDKIPKE